MSDLGTSAQILGHVDSARCIAEPDGRWSIRIEGWLTHGDSEFVVVQAGIPNEPVVMISSVPRLDVQGKFPSLPPDSKPGFIGHIPCSSPRSGPLDITFLGLLPNGRTAAFTMHTVVMLGEPVSRIATPTQDTPANAERVLSEQTHVLFMTDSLHPPTSRTARHLATLQELAREGFVVTLLETDHASLSSQKVRTPSLPDNVAYLALQPSDDLGKLLQRNAPLYDLVWVTQPGGLRLLNAMIPAIRGKIIFEPSVTISDNIIASASDIQVEQHVLGGRPLHVSGTLWPVETEPLSYSSPDGEGWIDIQFPREREVLGTNTQAHPGSFLISQSEEPLVGPFNKKGCVRLVSLEDQLGALLPLPWFVELANTADLVVTPDTESASALRALGVQHVSPTKPSKRALVHEALTSSQHRARISFNTSRHYLARTPTTNTSPESTSEAMLVDIVVPIHNAPYVLRDCLDALGRNTDLPSHLILVDDRSDDPQIEEILSSLPTKLRGTSIQALTILRLSRNAGFSGAVNLGIAAGTGQCVVLLNTDTLPPPRWLSRLIAPLITDGSIGSVTPLSNSATICSFRPLDESSHNFDPDALLRVDSLFARHGGTEPITIPTGVGFCLASLRAVYEEIGFLDADLFRKMYAEENDWCMRVIRAGLRNVVVTNLFVPHVDGASAKSSNVDRQGLLNFNLAKLRALYPDYDESVREFMREDPLQPIRDFMKLVLLRAQKRSAATLYVHNPELSGGSGRYLNQLLAQRSQKEDALVLAATSRGSFIQLSLDETQERIKIRDGEHLRELLTALNIRHIVVNQLVGSAYDILTEQIRTSGVPYSVHLHDFFFACPTITLIGHRGRYCGAETRASECSACLQACFGKNSDTRHLSITAWREQSYSFLSSASSLITVSEHAKNLYLRYFPNLSIQVAEPLVESSPPTRVPHDSSISLSTLKVAVIGAIGKHKGSDLIYEMVEILRNRALPIKIVVCGYTDRHSKPYIDRDGFFEVTGKYESSELPKLLTRHRIAFTLLPSLWPETFLYTASESMACGYPVMVSGLTAAAERVVERDAGWVLGDLTAAGIIAELERIFYNRHEITEKTRNLLATGSATADPNTPLVMAAKHPFKEFLVEL